MNRGVGEEDAVHVPTVKYKSATRKKELLPLGTAWVDFQGIMLRRASQAEKDEYYMTSSICGIFKKPNS